MRYILGIWVTAAIIGVATLLLCKFLLWMYPVGPDMWVFLWATAYAAFVLSVPHVVMRWFD